MIKIKKYQIEDYISDATQDALDLKADLVNGKVPASQLPSFVDDVIEVANYAALPIPGETGVIYITLNNNKVFRWTGSVYVEIASGVTNLSYTPGVSDGTVNSDTGTDAIIPLAGATNAGLFSATEKTKLEGIAAGANVGVVPNAPITGATKTKITYDSKGLVTAGADATTADIADSTNKRYVTDANLTTIGNQSGTNTGDDATNSQYSGLAASKQDKITLTTTGTSGASTLVGATLNIPQYSGATNLSYTASPTNGVVNSSTGTGATITLADATNAGLLKPAKFTVLENTSGTNTGDQDLSGLVIKNAAITGATKTKITYDTKGLVTAGVDATTADIADSTNNRYVTDADLVVIGNTSGTNTGDQNLQSVLYNGNTAYDQEIHLITNDVSSDILTLDVYTSDGGFSALKVDYNYPGDFASTAVQFTSNGTENPDEPGTGKTLEVNNTSSGNAIEAYSLAGRPIITYGDGPVAIESNLGTYGKGLVINSGTSSTGNFIELNKNGVDKFTINQEGEQSIVKIPGGLSTEYLMADGSTTTGSSGGITHTTASSVVLDTYTATVTGVTSYSDGDAYLVRFTDGNTTNCTLNINGIGAVPLNRNNDGPLLGGDINAGGEMLCVYNSAANTFQCIGISPNSLYAYVTNADSVTITKGMPVYAFSGTGDRMTVKKALNTGDATSAQTVGLVFSTSIAAGQKGFIMIQGLLDNLSILPTSTWVDGNPVYLGSTAGTITNIKPYAPNHLVYLGIVTTASNGSAGRIYVRVQNGYELDELHNVQAQSPTLKDTLWYDNTVSPAQWKTASISSILGYTPGTVSSVAALTLGTTGTDLSSTVATGTTTPVITLNVPNASATARGVVTTGTQTFAGAKTFSSAVTLTDINIATGGIYAYYTARLYTVGTGATHIFGGGGGNVQNDVSIPNGTFNIGLQTASTIASFDASKNVISLPTATYPSLTELAYVKGVTSSIQTQIDGKQATLVSGTNIRTVNGSTLLGSTNLSVGTVTSVTGTAPIVSSGGTTPAISMAAATASVDGYLTALNFTAFNNKVSAQTGQIIITSGTTSFTTPATGTLSTVYIFELVGGGGGGGGGLASSGNGSGGGAGGYVYKRITGLSGGNTYAASVVVGTGGTGTSTNGNAGASTTLNILSVTYTASGGGGGIGAVSSAGGAGGTGTNGDINITGQSGGDSLAAAASVPSSAGGSSPKGWGLGGLGVLTPKNGNNATGYGAGGSAGKGTTGTPVGGNGSAGIIMVTWFN